MANSHFHVCVRDLAHVFNDGRAELMALSGLSLDVPPGQFVAVIGPSGCGKSTLLRLVGGLLRPSQGTALVHGRPPKEAQKARDIGYVFQDPALLPWRTVDANVRLPTEVDGVRPPFGVRSPSIRPRLWQRLLRANGRRHPSTPPGVGLRGNGDKVHELLELVGLSEFRGYYPQQLSGGMQQRVALARALVFDPGLLLMDEPFGALDEITRLAMRYELLRVWESTSAGAAGKTVVFVTHSVAEAVALADRIIVLSARPGRVRADLQVELARPRTEEVERDAAFLDYTAYVRSLLKEEPV